MSLLLALCLVPKAASLAIETTANTDGLIPIAFDTSIRREVAAGGKDVFGISVGQRQLLRLLVEKGDVALSTSLYGPSGAKLFEQVSRDYEAVEISFPADVAGAYTIVIESLETAQPRRQYELRIQAVTSVTAAGQRDSEARQAMASAAALRATWTETALRQALERYDKATLTWTASGDSKSAAAAMLASGDDCFLLSEYHDSLRRYQNSAQLAVRTRDRLTEALALSQIGRVYSYLGNNDLGEKHVTKALDFFERDEANEITTGRRGLGEALSNLGEISYSKGDMVKSSAQFERAGKVFSEINDRNGEAKVHLFAGYIAGSLGEPEKAMAEISQALELYREVANKSGEGLSLTALALSHSLKRDEDGAIELHREAIEIFRGIGDQHSEAIALNALGQAYEDLSEYSVALNNYEKALRLFQNNGAQDLASVAMCKVASVYRLSASLDQALSYYQRCLRLSRAAGKVRTEANALEEVATIYAAHGHRERTLRQYRKLQKFYETIGDRPGQATALNSRGDFLLRLGEGQRALKAYSQALPLSKKAGDNGILISTLYNLARAHRDLGALEVALSYIKQSLKFIEDLRTNVGSADFRASYFSGVRKHYDLCIDILMQLDHARPGQGFAAAALLVSENARARSLLDLLTESRADLRLGATPELASRERELQSLLRSQAQYQMELSISGKDPSEIEDVTGQMAQLRTEYQEIQGRLRNQNPRVVTLLHPTPLSLEQIQADLRGEDTILLEYALGDERSYLWAVTSESLRSYELPSRATLEDQGREVYKLLTARQAIGEKIDGAYQANVEESDRLYHEKALELSQMLLGQVAEHLGNKRLVVVTEGVLQYIPLDALPTPAHQVAGSNVKEIVPGISNDLPLIATHEIVTLPSISTLDAIRQEKHKVASSNKIVAVLADPVFTSNDDRVENGEPHPAFSSDQSSKPALRNFEGSVPNGGAKRLLHASEEADAILAAAPRGTGMVARGFDASRETAMSSLVGEYKIVHFATHGFLNSEHPELSSIVLTMVNLDGSKTNGLMPLQDIYNLDLSADLIVLSACDTALGKDIKGEGLVGLTRGFMSAGSKSVVASLWKVDDRATGALMTEFYRSMLQEGMPPAAALRFAKQRIRQEKAWSAPYFWAGFVLQGEYKERIAVDSKSRLRMGVAVSLALVLISSGLMILQRRRRSYLRRQ